MARRCARMGSVPANYTWEQGGTWRAGKYRAPGPAQARTLSRGGKRFHAPRREEKRDWRKGSNAALSWCAASRHGRSSIPGVTNDSCSRWLEDQPLLHSRDRLDGCATRRRERKNSLAGLASRKRAVRPAGAGLGGWLKRRAVDGLPDQICHGKRFRSRVLPPAQNDCHVAPAPGIWTATADS